ncbi:MAG: hypothetical protein KC488_13950, partial [Candidatus Cloacimonetes bacterium]|nr:hypothetical protein [Candidatus Cloacimonadota bacterium]
PRSATALVLPIRMTVSLADDFPCTDFRETGPWDGILMNDVSSVTAGGDSAGTPLIAGEPFLLHSGRSI